MRHAELGAWFLLAASAAILAMVIADAALGQAPTSERERSPDFFDENWTHVLGAEMVLFEIWFLFFTL